MSDEQASLGEIQKLNEAGQVESEGAAGKSGVLPRETSSEAGVLEEESAEVVAGGWTFLVKDLQEMERIRNPEGPKSQGDDLNPQSVSAATAPEGARSGGPGKQKWLRGLWLPNGETGQADRASSESGDGRKEERKEQAPGLMEKIVSDENAALALQAVERNGGAAGIDGMRTEQLRPHLEKHWPTIRRKLLEGTYVPSPVKRVWLPKKMDGWLRRHMRKCFWQRWHGAKGRLQALRKLGLRDPLLLGARSGRGAWRMAKHPVMNKGLSNRTLKRYGFLCFADLLS